MNIKNFVLSYYNNSANNFHIQRVENSFEAKKPHTHEYFQIYYVSRGGLRHFVEENFSDLHQGDMFIVPPGIVHYVSPEPNTVFYSFSFMPDFFPETNPGNKFTSLFLRTLLSDQNILPKVSIGSEDILYIESIMNRMLEEFKQKKLGFSEIMHSYAVLLISVLSRNYFEENKMNEYFANNNQFVLHSIEYIKNNFSEQITLDEISKKATMSKNDFCKLFHKLTGHSFNTYLNMCRINKATDYIKEGYKITAIYGLCGYNDFSTFYRNFIKIMGMSPTEYKNQITAKIQRSRQ